MNYRVGIVCVGSGTGCGAALGCIDFQLRGGKVVELQELGLEGGGGPGLVRARHWVEEDEDPIVEEVLPSTGIVPEKVSPP